VADLKKEKEEKEEKKGEGEKKGLFFMTRVGDEGA
jgi:hypothetical protein